MTEAGSYTFFDHTGDFGVDVTAPDREGALAAFARSYLDLFTGDPGAVDEVEERDLELEGIDDADLLVALGNELIFLFEVEGFLAARLEVEDHEDGWLAGVLHGETYDPARHPVARPVKAVTHHGVSLREVDGRIHARVVFDL